MVKESIQIPENATSIHINKRKWVRAKVAGLFTPIVHNGSVKKDKF